MANQDLGKERRKYLRLDTVFPVEYRLLESGNLAPQSSWLQGFTNNIGKGGICLVVNNLSLELAQKIQRKEVKLSLEIEIPVTGKTIPATAHIAWIREDASQPNRYIIGLSYEHIDARQNSSLMRYAWFRRLFFPVSLTLVIILSLGLAAGSYLNIKLIKGNKALVAQLINIVQESSIAKQKIKKIDKEKEDLDIKMQTLLLQMKAIEEEKAKFKDKIKSEEIKKSKKTNELNFIAEQLTKEKALLQEELIVLQHKENAITEELLHLDKKKATLQKSNIDNMYKWIKIHQNARTGLVMSFEGDRDIAGWAFTYDQALTIIAYSDFADFARARRILDFFNTQAKRSNGLFFNAYCFSEGSPVEYIVHSGPNIWLGIAVAQYTYKSKDRSFLGLAEDIARAQMQLQTQDSEGGIRGGPEVAWFSTEHNLDAYAFFNMLYKLTNKKQYLEARDKVLKWLVNHTYDKTGIPIKRGKGDATIATDTYAWSIAAVGPAKLEEVGMNPDKIINFAEDNCSVEVSYNRPDGQIVKIKGFDFAPQQHLPRGGVVSSEWTAQMILSLKIMSEFYYKKEMIAKARAYGFKADEYLTQLSKMIISSASASGQGEGCLPYATQDDVDTGHGWMTPKGKSTGSVAGTAYTIFAYYGYNPLEFRD